MRRIAVVLVLFSAIACDDLRTTKVSDPAAERRIAQARAAVDASPNDAKKVAELADAYLAAGRSFEAADGFDRAIQLGSKDGHVYGALADIYVRFGYLNRAVEELKTCMQVDRQQPECLLALGLLFETDPSRQAQDEARRAFKAMLAVAPNHPRAAYVRSRIDQLDARLGPDNGNQPAVAASQPSGEDDEGEGEEDEGSAEGEANPHAAQIPGHEGGTDSSEVGELNPFGAALQKAFAAVRKNDPVAAEKAFREALAINKTDPTALSGLAQSLLAEKKLKEAIDTAELAMKSDPTSSEAKYTLGLVLLSSHANAEQTKRGVDAWEDLAKTDADYAKRMGVSEQLEQIKRFVKQGSVHQ